MHPSSPLGSVTDTEFVALPSYSVARKIVCYQLFAGSFAEPVDSAAWKQLCTNRCYWGYWAVRPNMRCKPVESTMSFFLTPPGGLLT